METPHTLPPDRQTWTAALRKVLTSKADHFFVPWRQIPAPLTILLQQYAATAPGGYQIDATQGVERTLLIDLCQTLAMERLAAVYRRLRGCRSEPACRQAARQCIGIMLAWAEFALPARGVDMSKRLSTVKWLVETENWERVLRRALGTKTSENNLLWETITQMMPDLLTLPKSETDSPSESATARRWRDAGWEEIALQAWEALRRPDTQQYGVGDLRHSFWPPVIRRGVMEDLWERVEKAAQEEGMTVLGVVGAAGVGKTTLLEWARDRAQEEFRTAKMFLLGEEPRFLPYLRELAYAFGRRLPLLVPQLEDAVGMVHSVLRRHRVFVALDDVRAADDVRPFLVGGAGSVLVVGTRYVEVLDDLGVPANHRLHVGSMTEEEALYLCERLAGPLEEWEQKIARQVIQEVEGHPLAVASLAAQGPTIGWRSIVRILEAERRSPTVEGENPWERRIRTMQESVWEMLTEEQRAWLLDLACLPAAASFDVRALQSVRPVAAEVGQDRLNVLARRHVIQVGKGSPLEEPRYRMHWLWRRFVRQKARAAGRKVEDTAWVERYPGVLVKPGQWWWPSYPSRRPWRFRYWLRRWYLRPVPPQRRGVVEGVRSLKEPYYKAIGEAWARAGLETEALPLEVHGTRLLLRRRSNRYGRWVVLTGSVMIGPSVLSWGLQTVLGKGPVLLPKGVTVLSGLAFALAVWVFAVHLVNLYRFMDCWVDGQGQPPE